jgi:O-antigen/teichoic acid export membrane protein
MTTTTPSSSVMRAPGGALSCPSRKVEGLAKAESHKGKGGGTLRQLAIRGSLWIIGSLLVAQIIKLFSNIVLARLLNPEIFGLAALAAVITSGLEMLSDIGIGPSIVQHQHGDDPRFLNTAWTLQVLRGFLIAAVLALIAVPISQLYQDSRLGLILALSGATVAIAGFNSTALYTLNRHLEVRQNCALNVLGDAMATGATILSAFVTPTVWAIIIGGYVRSIFRLIASHRLNTGVPNQFCWDSDSRRALFAFGKWVFVSTAISFFANQTDRLILGRLESLETLGVYSLALIVAATPQFFGQRLAQMVLFPVFAKQARGDLSLLERKVMGARRVVLSGGLFAILSAMLASPWFFRSLYDERYAAAGWLTQILCVYTWFAVLQLSADRALLAVGDARSLALSNGVNVAVTALGCIVGHWFGGLLGFTIGLCLSTLAGHIVIQVALARRGIHILGQDMVYSLLMLALGAGGALGPRLMAAPGTGALSLGVSLALGLPVIAIMGGWTSYMAWKELFQRQSENARK